VDLNRWVEDCQRQSEYSKLGRLAHFSYRKMLAQAHDNKSSLAHHE
jgi:hypothetical protein